MKKALGQSEQRFQELIENSLMGISIIQGDRFIFLNTEQQRIFGPKQELKRFRDLMIHEDDQRRFKQICNAIERKKPLKTDVEIRFYPSEEARLRQEFKHVIVRTDLISYQSETMTLVNMVDITQSKRMEHLALLRSKMVSLGHISVGIAHEIRSPLTGINLLIQGIRENILTPDSTEDVLSLLNQVEKATDKIETVVKRVLDYAKPSDPQVKPAHVNQTILSAVELSESAIRKANIVLTTQLSSEISELYIDTHLMEQVFLNLISNAIAALQDNKSQRTLTIRSLQQGNDVLISFADSGPGIPEHLRDKIFDPFFSTRKSGTGIGLAICQRVVTDHGGVINISTSKYHGAQFNIRLPIEKRLFKR